ncbi:hypothetical protein [Yimella sp. cx-51]|uniref:hypothetical protein n=1 Tax=Yimella sp. cx-51 TaxID=2770551 RepID=UPI00165DBC83|nr:hypothetical protein [Yimella sp. cx-51]MBC9958155.1 hypothetical protein [Yimella sp. cx-51]QTH38808.1 hypothetical protein J5M86_03985 [Yimella sp. cx-51]
MNMIPAFFTGFSVVLAVSLIAMVAVLGTWTVQFFARNRSERVATRQPMARYYRDLGAHAFSH